MTKITHPQLIVVLATTLALAGCAAPTKQIKDFGAASGSVAADAKKGYAFLDDSIKKKQIYVAALHPERPVTIKTFAGILSENQRLSTRTELLGHLADYATALQQLSDKDFRKDIDAASKDLAGSLSDLKGNYEKLSGSKLAVTKPDIGILATVVDAAGSAYVEWKRKEALKTIVTKTDPAIQQVARLLKSEFADIGPAVETQLGRVETTLEKGYNEDAAKLDYQKRVEILTNIQASHDNAANAGQLFVTVGEAAAKMGKAHSTLNAALQQNKLTTPQLVADVRELVKWAQSVKDFYSSLK